MLYRAVAKHDDDGVHGVLAGLAVNGGSIGNSQFVDIWINEGEMLVDRHRLRDTSKAYQMSAAEIDANHSWYADGVWVAVPGDLRTPDGASIVGETRP